VAAAVVTLLIFLGCMSISIGEKTTEIVNDGSFVQEGNVRLRAGAEQVIWYPIPYASPPNLQMDDDDCVILEQREDHFRVGNTDHHFSSSTHWKARGVKATPPPVDPPPLAAPGLPPAPVPVPTSP
jgi:hypothetical protein